MWIDNEETDTIKSVFPSGAQGVHVTNGGK
jgi:hypothetical protein